MTSLEYLHNCIQTKFKRAMIPVNTSNTSAVHTTAVHSKPAPSPPAVLPAKSKTVVPAKVAVSTYASDDTIAPAFKQSSFGYR